MSGAVVVHGGAGVMRSLEGERARAYAEGLVAAARAGREVLRRGHGPLEAVQAATRVMEALGVFNAGAGACLDAEGQASLDAALMRGSDRGAGAVGACRATVHPVDLCRDLLEEGRHVLLVGEGADRRARRLALPPLPPVDAERQETFARLSGRGLARPEELGSVGRPDDAGVRAAGQDSQDTVGAVAVDARGRVAAAVSTGGLWLKAPGRVGDSAIVGAGLFACDDLGAAASATGIGERMIRCLTSLRACEGGHAPRGARAAVAELERRFGPDSGGVIVVDRQGRVGWGMNTRGMGRALARLADEQVPVAIWPEDPFPAE